MAYANKEQDHEKRKNQEGTYSPYGHIYQYLLSNYEPGYAFTDADKSLMLDEYVRYCEQGGSDMTHAKQDIKDAIANFTSNNREHGDTAQNLGNRHENSIKSIASTISDLRW
jgi:hypothetical protein